MHDHTITLYVVWLAGRLWPGNPASQINDYNNHYTHAPLLTEWCFVCLKFSLSCLLIGFLSFLLFRARGRVMMECWVKFSRAELKKTA